MEAFQHTHGRTFALLRVSVLSHLPVSNLDRVVSSQNVRKLKRKEPCVKALKLANPDSLGRSERTCSRCGVDARVAAAVQVDHADGLRAWA